MKNILSLTMLLTMMVLPLYSVYAQEAVDQQFYEAAIGLDPDARSEFLQLLRSPGSLEESFGALNIDPGLADRIEQRINQTNQRHNTEHALQVLEKSTEIIGAHLEKLASMHAGKSREALENALMKRTAGLAKAVEALSKDTPGAANVPDAVINNPGNGVIGGGGGPGGAGGAGGVGGAGGIGGGGAGGMGGGGAGGAGGGAGGAGGAGGPPDGAGGGADNGNGNGADNGKGKK